MSEPKVINFPKAKAASAPKTDKELADAVRAAHRKLCRTIDACLDVGLDVELRLDSRVRWNGRNGEQVRLVGPRFTRSV